MNKNPLSKLSELILTLNPYELSTLAFVIGLLLCEDLDGGQLEALGNFYELLGQTILTVGAQVENQNNYINSPNVEQAVSMLKSKVGNIEKIITDFKNL